MASQMEANFGFQTHLKVEIISLVFRMSDAFSFNQPSNLLINALKIFPEFISITISDCFLKLSNSAL